MSIRPRLPRSPAALRLAFAVAALVVAIGLVARLRQPLPDFDSLEYLAYARSLVVGGTYASTPEGPSADSAPGREPLYPALIAAIAAVWPAAGEAVVSCHPPAEACKPGFHALQVSNVLLFAGTAVLALVGAQVAGGGRTAALIAGAYVLLNVQAQRDLRYLVSDYLGLFLAAAAGLALAFAVAAPYRVRRWAAAGAALALLALTKGAFLPFALLVTAVAAVAGLVRLRAHGMRALAPAAALAAILGIAAGGWAVRNHAHFGTATDGRGAIALSTREVFTHMTPGEHLAAWVWWTRGFGDGLARALLPADTWRRHEWYAADGFFQTGQVTNHQRRLAGLMAEGLPAGQAQNRAAGVVADEILSAWPSYLATMPVLIYRGLWADEFVLFGAPALVWLVIRGWRRRDWRILALVSPGVWSLLFYPAISLNIPRYQLTALAALATAAGLAAEAMLARRRKRSSQETPAT